MHCGEYRVPFKDKQQIDNYTDRKDNPQSEEHWTIRIVRVDRIV